LARLPLGGSGIPYVGIALFILAAVVLYAWYAPSRFDRFTITDTMLIRRKGLLTKESTQMSLASIRTVKVSQTPLQRLADIGDVTIVPVGDFPELVVRGLPDPDRIRALVQARVAAQAA
jgi:uncharacterized membrane protein YdbT with pleckstrin-like domain